MLRPTRRRLIALVAAGLGLWLAGWLLRGHPTTLIDSYDRCADAGYPVTDTNPPACTAGATTFLGARATPSPSPPPAVSQAFNILVQGDSGGRYPKGQQIITTPAAWSAYWRDVHSHLSPVPPLPAIDFAAYDVIVLSEGPQATGGYSLKVTGITTSAAGSVINITDSIPTITCRVVLAASNRYFIARTAKLTPPVSFRITTTHRRCD